MEFKNRLNDEKVRKLSAVAGKVFHGAITLSEKSACASQCGYYAGIAWHRTEQTASATRRICMSGNQ